MGMVKTVSKQQITRQVDAMTSGSLAQSKAALTADQQGEIMARVKKYMTDRQRVRKLAASFGATEKRFKAIVQQQDDCLRDFLKEL